MNRTINYDLKSFEMIYFECNSESSYVSLSVQVFLFRDLNHVHEVPLKLFTENTSLILILTHN